MAAKKHGMEIRVGIFMVVAVTLLIVVIIALTGKSQLFKTTFALHTSFSNVAGLLPGSEVRLSGINIGLVEQIQFTDQEGKTLVLVQLRVDQTGMDRITKDSKAIIQTLGLLGSKYVEILPGTPEAGLVQEGDFINSVEPISMTEALDKGNEILDAVRKAAKSIEHITGSLQGVQGKESDLAKSITHIKNILHQVEHGSGMAHSLIYDKDKAQILTNIRGITADVKTLTGDVKTGNGTLNTLIYGTEGKELIANITDASKEIRDVIAEIKTGKGLVHSLIYEEERAGLIDELKLAAQNLREISEKVNRGEGTLGALLVDPTIYEDVKKITGEVERSTILKAYIRYTIRKNEAAEESKDEPDKDWSDHEG